jgi:hypothetical protein
MRCATRRRHRIAHAHTDLVDEAGLLGQDLRRLDQNVGGALVDRPNAGPEQADHLRADAGSVARLHRDVGADTRPDLLRQPLAEDDGMARPVEGGQRALAHLRGERRHLGLAVGVDADDARRHVARGVAQDRLRLGGGRDRAGHPALQRRHDRQRVLDAAPARIRCKPADLRGVERRLRRLQRRLAALIGHGDVRQGIDQLAHEVVLGALHQRRHHDREADAGGDAGHRHQRLPQPEAHVVRAM